MALLKAAALTGEDHNISKKHLSFRLQMEKRRGSNTMEFYKK